MSKKGYLHKKITKEQPIKTISPLFRNSLLNFHVSCEVNKRKRGPLFSTTQVYMYKPNANHSHLHLNLKQ